MNGDAVAGLGGFEPGSRIGSYLLGELVGYGGMAVVFRALDVRLNRQVALKILAPAVAADEGFRQRFVRESQAAAAVDDPHIIPVFEAGEVAGTLFIAMRLVEGGDVGTLVHREGSLPGTWVTSIISPVAAALDAAHEKGLVHRDVKPGNMLLDMRLGRPDHVYLSDFGLSKASLAVSGLTGTGMFLGTPDYAAPEQIEGKLVDGRADQYALAAAAFELLTGLAPFHREEQMAVIYAQVSQPPPAVTSRRPDLPQAVDGVFARALAKNPAARFARCQDFADALRLALGLAMYDTGPASRPHPTQAAYLQSAGPDVAPDQRASQDTATVAPHPVGSSRPYTAGPPTEAAWPAPHPAAAAPARYHPSARQHPDDGRKRRHRAAAAIGVVIVIGAAGVAGALVAMHHSHQPGLSSQSAAGSAGRAAPVKPVNWPAGQSERPLLELGTGQTSDIVEGLAFTPDGHTIVIATFDAVYLVLAASANQTASFLDPASRGIKAVAVSPGGATAATADRNGRTYLWNIAGGTAPAAPAAALRDPASAGVLAVAYSPDGTTLATGDANGTTYLWKITAGTAAASPAVSLSDPSGTGVQTVAFSPDGTTLATGDANGQTYLWKITAASPASTPAATLYHPGAKGTYGTVAVAYSPDGKTLAAGGYTGQTYLWDISTRTVIATLQDPSSASSNFNIQAAQFAPGGSLATADTNGSTFLWTAR